MQLYSANHVEKDLIPHKVRNLTMLYGIVLHIIFRRALNGVDARVNLNETPNIQEQVTDATGTRTKPEEL